MKPLVLFLLILGLFLLVFFGGGLFDPDAGEKKGAAAVPGSSSDDSFVAEEDAGVEDAENPEVADTIPAQQQEIANSAADRTPQYDESFRQQVSKLGQSIPSIEEVRAQVTDNPHGTPPAYIDFASSLAPLMEQALVDKDNAKDLFVELEHCALSNDRAPTPIQSICFQNMKRLSEAHPEELQEAFQQARSQADPDQQDFLKFMEM